MREKDYQRCLLGSCVYNNDNDNDNDNEPLVS